MKLEVEVELFQTLEAKSMRLRELLSALSAKAPQVACADDMSQYVASVIHNHVEKRLDAVLPDSLNRSLEERIAALLERAQREAEIAVKLRTRAEENGISTSDI